MTPPVPPPTPTAFHAWREGFWRRILTARSGPQRRRAMAVTFLLVGVIGTADYLTGVEASLLVFYFLPVSLAVATSGWRFGTLISVLSVVTWLAADIAAGAHYANPLIPGWNAVIALGTYLVLVWLLSSLIALQREMEERVLQRTAALTEEIAERVRLERVVLEISERERRSIGHDLHDGLSQHLTGTALVAQALQSRLAPRAPADAADAAQVVALVEAGIEQTRTLARGLLLAEIERDGLVPALRGLAATSSAQFRVACQYAGEAEMVLNEGGTATHLYRIAEEATRNAARHGRPAEVRLTLTRHPGHLELAVRDNGAGLPPSGARGQGLGLRIMAHRASIIGGTLAIEPAPGGGTVVLCRLPLPPSSP
jgi:signal transduction histidine kinase